MGYTIMKLNISSNYPTKLYLHRDNQFLDISGRMGYFVHQNESTQHQVTINGNNL